MARPLLDAKRHMGGADRHLETILSAQEARALPPYMAAIERDATLCNEATRGYSDGVPSAVNDAVISNAGMGPWRLTLADLSRISSLTSSYAAGLSLPMTDADAVVVKQAASLQPLAWSGFAGLAADPEPLEVIERAGDQDADIVMVLSTMVAWLQQQTQKEQRQVEQRQSCHLDAVVAGATICSVLIGVLQLFGIERTLRALEALAKAISSI
jgi:hypothetical protein